MIGERDGVGIDGDACALYLVDAPPQQSGEFMAVSDADMQAAMASVAHEVQPRCAHYHLIHRVLAQLVLEDPRVGQLLWEHVDAVGLFDDLAGVVNADCAEQGEEWAMPPQSFRLGHTEVLGRPVIVIDVVAPPVATTEAHMFALVGQPWEPDADHRAWSQFDRYFVLEHSVSQGPTHTVMGEWTTLDGSLTHLNMGPGPKPTPANFVHAIGRNLCGDFVEARTRMSE